MKQKSTFTIWYKTYLTQPLNLFGVMVCLMVISGNNAFGQIAYTRSTFTGTYSTLTTGGGATQLLGGTGTGALSSSSGVSNIDDGTAYIPLPFNFNYNGTTFTSGTNFLGICTNGYVYLSAINTNASKVTTQTNTNLFSTTTPNNTIAPWYDDLDIGPENGLTGTLLYQTTGSAGSQILTVQWGTFPSFFQLNVKGLNFQLKLYESTNVIEFWYGAVDNGITFPNQFNTSESASIGIEDATGGPNHYIDGITGSQTVGHAMLSSNEFPVYNIRFTPGAPSPIAAGTYNVGVGQTFPNLTEAIAALNNRGVSGAVVFNMTDALYDTTVAGGSNTFPLCIGTVSGASASNTITFTKSGSPTLIRARGSDAGNVLTAGSTTAIGTANEPIIGILGGDYIKIEMVQLSLVGIGTATSRIDRGLLVLNNSATDGSQFNSFFDVFVDLDRTNTSSIGIQQNALTTPTSASGTNSNNIYKNLNIKNVYAGIQLTGNAGAGGLRDTLNEIGTTLCTNFNIIGDPATANDIGNNTTATFGINVTNQASVKIYNNSIRNVTNTGGQADGINLVTFAGISQVYNNKIQTIKNSGTTSTTAIAGIRASHTTTAGQIHTARIYNNAVSEILSGYTGTASATRTIKGIFIAGTGGGTTQNYEVYDNSVSIDGSASPNISSACFEISTSSGPLYNLGNNIFANFTVAQGATAKHSCIVSTSATVFGPAGTTSNNNNFWIANDVGTSGVVGIGNATPYNTVASWAGAMTPAGMESASISSDPQFFNNISDLHATATGLNGSGMIPPGYITVDLDCSTRTPDDDIGAYKLDACSGAPTAGSISGANSVCNGFGTTLTLTGATTGAGISYQWSVSTTSGSGYSNLGTGLTQATGPLTVPNYYIVTVTCAFGSSATTTEKAVLINASPSITVLPTSGLICNPGGSPISLTASGGDSYTWSPTTGLTPTTGSPVSANPSVVTTYTVTGTDANGCTGTATASISIGLQPSIPVITPSAPAICPGGNVALNASSTILTPASNTLGTGTSTSVLSSTVSDNFPNVFAHYYGGNKHQMLILASELSSLGMVNGSVISSLGFNVASVNRTDVLQSYEVKMGNTGASSITTFQTGLAIARTAANYTTNVSPGINTISLDFPFTWNGTSNIIIETSYSNNDAPATGNVTMTFGTTSFSSTVVFRADNTLAATMNAYTGTPTFTYSSRPNIVFGFTAPSPLPGSAFSWNPTSGLTPTSGSPVTASPSSATTYTVTATNGACSSSNTVTVSLNSLPVIGSCPADITQCVNPVATWSDPTATGTPAPTVACVPSSGSTFPIGTTTVVCTATNICGSSTCSFTVTINDVPTITCPAPITTCNPVVTFAPSSTGTPAPAVSCTPPSGSTFAVGTTTVNCEATNSCGTAICSFTVTVNEAPSAITCPTDIVSCNPVVIYSTPTSTGTPTPTVTCTPPSGSTFATGVTTVTCTASNVCGSTTCSFTVTINDPISITCPAPITVNTSGACDQVVTFAPTADGVPTPTVSCTPASGSVFAVGTTTVNCTATNSCGTATCSFTVTVVDNEPPLIGACPGNMASCFGLITYTDPTATDNCGSATVICTPSSGSTFSVGVTTVNCVATDTHSNTSGCSFTVTIHPTPSVTITPTNISSPGGTDGAASAAGSGGTDPYGYIWSTGSTNASITNLVAGTYTVTVTDFNGCSSSASVTLTEANNIAITLTPTGVSCFAGNNGSVTSGVTGGTPPYSYSWSSGQTTQNISGLVAGTYTVTVTDFNGITKSGSIAVSQPGLLVASGTKVDIACRGTNTGNVTMAPTGGTVPYTYLWNNGSTTQNRSSLAPGTYTVTVNDANGCGPKTASFTFINPATNLLINSNKVNIRCPGSATGEATAAPSGGTAPYTYSWNTIPIQTTANITALLAGVYTCEVTDAVGCTKTLVVTITEPPVFNVVQTQSNVTFPGGSNGSASVAVSGGTPGYTYNWNTVPVKTTATITGLTAGVYKCTISDTKTCLVKVSFTITEPISKADGSGNVADKQELSVFPNPTNGMISVKISGLNGQENIDFYLVDVTGRIVYQNQIEWLQDDVRLFDFSILAKGVYYIRSNSQSNNLIQKIVIQ